LFQPGHRAWLTIFHEPSVGAYIDQGPVSRKKLAGVTENGDSGRALLRTAPRAPQRSFQLLLLLIPAGFFSLRSLLEGLDSGLDGGGPLRVLLLGLVQRSLRLVDGLLPAFTVLLPGGLFARPFKLAAPTFPFVVESGLSFRNLIDGARGRASSPLGLSTCGRLSLVHRRQDRWAVRHFR
jgi:hypothetical protein